MNFSCAHKQKSFHHVTYRFCGYANALAYKDIDEDDIESVQDFVRNELPQTLEAELKSAAIEYSRATKSIFFGGFVSEPQQFHLLPDEKRDILDLARGVKRIVDYPEENSNIKYFESVSFSETRENCLIDSVFGLIFGDKRDSLDPKDSIAPNTNKTFSKTHTLLSKLLAAAEKNSLRPKPGYRYEYDIQLLATALRILAGPYCYETLQKNLEMALPSLTTINRYIRDSSGDVVDGKLRSEELFHFLNERNLPLIVSVSEDSTRIDGRIQYDFRSNQVVGFPLPIDQATGMPIPYSFEAKDTTSIYNYFFQDPAQFITVVMAQPMAKFPPFCLLAFASDTKSTTTDVMNRWKFIDDELRKLNIRILTMSSDSDPKYNTAMRKRSKMGMRSASFIDCDWFCSGLDDASGLYDFQDIIHIVTKLRNRFLKTFADNQRLPFGKNFFIHIGHLEFLLRHFSKGQHQLTPFVLNPTDKQNFGSAVRMCDDSVLKLLRSHVANSEGTIAFLSMMRDIIDAFYNKSLSPLQRIEKIWYVVFLLRHTREYVSSSEIYSVSKNFLTQNCYACIEINAHNLVNLILFLKKNDMDEHFLPSLYNSQPCEEFFRKLRSFTSTFSTMVNCTIKDMLGRMKKVHLLSNIENETTFTFPRNKNSHQFDGYNNDKLPTREQIVLQIETCRENAQKYAIEVGLVDENKERSKDICRIPVLTSDNKKSNQIKNKKIVQVPLTMRQNMISLQNFALKFKNEDEIPVTSQYVEVHRNHIQRFVVKKTYLCWLLRKEIGKLSNDRIRRVMGVNIKQAKKNKKSGMNKKTAKRAKNKHVHVSAKY